MPQVVTNTDRTIVDVDGLHDPSNDQIRYIGQAGKMDDGTWRCLASVDGMLCIVEVTVTFEDCHG